VRDANHDFVFDLSTDTGERRDLTRLHPAIARRLRQRLLAWEQEVDTEAHSRRATPGGPTEP